MTPDVGGGAILDEDVIKFLPFDDDGNDEDSINDCVDDEMEKSVINPPAVLLSSSSILVHDDDMVIRSPLWYKLWIGFFTIGGVPAPDVYRCCCCCCFFKLCLYLEMLKNRVNIDFRFPSWISNKYHTHTHYVVILENE